MRAVVLLAGLFIAATAAAQNAYRYVMPDGRVIYSDMPVPGARLDGTIAPPAPVSPAPGGGPTLSTTQEALLKSADERIRRLNELTVEIQNLERELQAANARLEAGREPLEGERIGTYAGRSRLSDTYWARQDYNQLAVADIAGAPQPRGPGAERAALIQKQRPRTRRASSRSIVRQSIGCGAPARSPPVGSLSLRPTAVTSA